jgi:hypothetical protein
VKFVIANELVIGFAPPVVALMVIPGYDPGGVPGFGGMVLPLPPLPPQEPSHKVEQPRITIKLSKRRPRVRDPITKTTPNKPGSNRA